MQVLRETSLFSPLGVKEGELFMDPGSSAHLHRAAAKREIVPTSFRDQRECQDSLFSAAAAAAAAEARI